jgi:phosphatidylglycerophosphatase A
MASRKREKIHAARVLRDPVCFIAFGFGSGLAPKAPGMAGTLAALPLWLLASALPLPAYLALTVLMFAVGVWLCGRCEEILGVQDHSGIVWDEFAGLFIALAAMPASPAVVAAGFVLFRLFDALKPWPISWFDRHVHGGLGIMLDDALAGLCAFGCLFALLRLGVLA